MNECKECLFYGIEHNPTIICSKCDNKFHYTINDLCVACSPRYICAKCKKSFLDIIGNKCLKCSV